MNPTKCRAQTKSDTCNFSSNTGKAALISKDILFHAHAVRSPIVIRKQPDRNKTAFFVKPGCRNVGYVDDKPHSPDSPRFCHFFNACHKLRSSALTPKSGVHGQIADAAKTLRKCRRGIADCRSSIHGDKNPAAAHSFFKITAAPYKIRSKTIAFDDSYVLNVARTCLGYADIRRGLVWTKRRGTASFRSFHRTYPCFCSARAAILIS